MTTATFNGRVIAKSDDTTIVEGNHYFPLDALARDVVSGTDFHTECPWKGTASYFTLEVNGEVAENAAWYYPEPKDGAEKVAGRVAFDPVVVVES